MKTYWDYSEMERSQLTEEQVKALLDVELMTAGALKPVAPKLKKMRDDPIGKTTQYFTLEVQSRYGGTTRIDLCFPTSEKANAFLELNPFLRDYDYSIGEDYKFAKAISGGALVAENLYSVEQINEYKSELRQRKAAKEENEKKTAAYTKACEATDKITDGVWKDWHSCVSKRNDLQAVVDTYSEYLKLTGDDSTLAMKFLGKAFDATTIDEARSWFPDQIADWPQVTDGPAHCPDPAPQSTE